MKTTALSDPRTAPAPVSVTSAAGDVAAVDGVDGLHRVDQPVQRGDLTAGQHDEDGEDRDAVHQGLGHPCGADRGGDVASRVVHLLRGRRGQLDSDERVEKHRDDGDEDRSRRAEVCEGHALHAVLHAVGHHAHREHPEQNDLPDGSARRHPLAPAERDHGSNRCQQHEGGAEHEHAGSGEITEEPAVDGDGDRGDGPAEPHRSAGPVEQRGQRTGETAERHPHPDVHPALLRDGGAELGTDECGRHEEEGEEDHQPGEGLDTADGDGADRVNDHHRRDEEQDRVETTQLTAKLGELGVLPRRGQLVRQAPSRVRRATSSAACHRAPCGAREECGQGPGHPLTGPDRTVRMAAHQGVAAEVDSALRPAQGRGPLVDTATDRGRRTSRPPHADRRRPASA